MSASRIVIHCMGDSHASFFSGQDAIQPLWPERSENLLPFFKSYRLGAVTAYHLASINSSSGGREAAFRLLQSEIVPGSFVLLSFGEIDCRTHLLRQRDKQGRSMESVVEECVSRYAGFISEVQQLGYKTIVWGVPPSTPRERISDAEYPVYGTPLERNAVTKYFNQCLEKFCATVRIPFICIFDEIVEYNGLTKKKYLMDSIHLSQRAMSLTLRCLKRKCIIKNVNPSLFYLIKNYRSFFEWLKLLIN